MLSRRSNQMARKNKKQRPIITLCTSIMEIQSQSNQPKLSENTITLLYLFRQRTNNFQIIIWMFYSLLYRKKAMVDTPMLKKIKVIQLNEMKTWKGLHVEYISRPGKFANTYKLNISLDCIDSLLICFYNLSSYF